MKPFINNIDDIMELLDSQVESISWNDFYELRNHPANFIIQKELPDENLVEFFDKGIPKKSCIEFGCGEGRNAIYMAKQGTTVTAIDSSEIAIQNAKDLAHEKSVSVNFLCQDALKGSTYGLYDFAYDSGMFHHLAPHRRLTYIELLKTILKPSGYFGLVCFAWGEDCADEVDDWEFYQQRERVGVAFTKERLIELFTPYFEVIEIRKYRNGVPDTIQGLDFMWTCLFKNRIEIEH
ncbi:MAG: Methyltransferase type 12 [Herbinix sp.]|jgi:SAM-dependent methyltransferase|nr:Methyltransferase type 12 [Herbinix sp.]